MAKWLLAQPQKFKILVAGNHDSCFEARVWAPKPWLRGGAGRRCRTRAEAVGGAAGVRAQRAAGAANAGSRGSAVPRVARGSGALPAGRGADCRTVRCRRACAGAQRKRPLARPLDKTAALLLRGYSPAALQAVIIPLSDDTEFVIYATPWTPKARRRPEQPEAPESGRRRPLPSPFAPRAPTLCGPWAAAALLGASHPHAARWRGAAERARSRARRPGACSCTILPPARPARGSAPQDACRQARGGREGSPRRGPGCFCEAPPGRGGAGAEPPRPCRTPAQAILGRWGPAGERADCVLSHGPPLGLLDSVGASKAHPQGMLVGACTAHTDRPTRPSPMPPCRRSRAAAAPPPRAPPTVPRPPGFPRTPRHPQAVRGCASPSAGSSRRWWLSATCTRTRAWSTSAGKSLRRGKRTPA